MIKKKYIKPNQLFQSSLELGMKIYDSGYKPNYISGIWRGGIQTAINIQELLEYLNIKTKNIFIGSSSYSNVEKQNTEIKVFGHSDIIKNLTKDDKILLIDDVYDTGLTTQKVIEEIYNKCKTTPDIQIATIYFKPKNNKTNRKPDFYVYKTKRWLVFPHELVGLYLDEIINHKSLIKSIRYKFSLLKNKMIKNTST